MSITIGIDLRVLATGKKSGIEEYTEQLLAHMLSLDTSVQYKLFYASASHRLEKYSWLKQPNVTLCDFRVPNRFLSWGATLAGLPKIDKKIGGVDIFFSPHFLLAPLSAGMPQVITFHDLSFEMFPEFFSLRQRLWHSVQMHPMQQAEQASKIIAVSESTKNDLMDTYGIDESKIKIIYSGISPAITPSARKNISEYMKNHGINQRYILAFGTLEPRKNINNLIEAFTLLKGDDKFSDIALVVAGAPGWLYDDTVSLLANSNFGRDIICLPEVKDNERALLYSGASLLVYPSYFEGFGFPPLEAMRCGIPVIASNTSSLPEVLGNSALLVNPYSVSELTGAIRAVLEDGVLHKTLADNGLVRASSFSWEISARQTLDLLLSTAVQRISTSSLE